MGSEPDPVSRALRLAVHELRTPITVAAGYLRMLAREKPGPLTPAQRTMVDEAERACSRLTALVTEMNTLGLLLAGPPPVPPLTVDLTAITAQAVENSRETAQARSVEVDLHAPEPVHVKGDAGGLSTAVGGLIDTAIRESVQAGAVSVRCSAHITARARWAVLLVGDARILTALTGDLDGTPPDFEEWRGGAGLALPISRRIIEAHGGAVWSAPAPNPRAGSAVRLPLA